VLFSKRHHVLRTRINVEEPSYCLDVAMKILITFLISITFILFAPLARAGQGILLPNAVSGVMYAVAFSYPDTLRHGENYTVSMNMAVLFNNVSVKSISITQIDFFVVPENENPSGSNHEVVKYFVGEQWISGHSEPLYVIRRESLGETVVANFNETQLNELDYFSKGTTAKMYVEIQFFVSTDTARYPFTYFADSGEMPRVQLLPSESAVTTISLYENAGILAAILLGTIGCAIFLIALRLRANKRLSLL
jgi:hypothetical protein